MDILPDVTVTDAGGQPLRLADLPRPLVVYFYPKDDTPGCTREAQDFSALADRFAAAGVTVIGVSRDTVDKHARFTAKHGLTGAGRRSGRQRHRGVRRVGREAAVRQDLYGDRARDLPVRRRRPAGARMAQGEGARSCRGGVGGGDRTQLSCAPSAIVCVGKAAFSFAIQRLAARPRRLAARRASSYCPVNPFPARQRHPKSGGRSSGHGRQKGKPAGSGSDGIMIFAGVR